MRDKLVNKNGLLNISKEESIRYLVTYILQCYLILSDGIRIHDVVQLLLSRHLTELRISNKSWMVFKQEAIEYANFPTVRVINLKRRKDRWDNFIMQARRQQLMTVLAVTALKHIEPIALNSSCDINEDDYLWGNHAFDGEGSHLKFEERLSHQKSGKAVKLSRFIATHWIPNDLIAFDREARNDVKQVRMTPSERACALSHISSWVGVERCLSIAETDSNVSNGILHSRNDKILRLFKISGYAQGASILSENKNIAPSPVCVILEDDAALVDRFSDQLSVLLKELPRDFHFCSLGYSRPKSAPMIRYTTHVGVPTCLWYLTGYILSLDGARFLLKNLPVRGPVDSWIGLKMTSNWDNIHGEKIGVGHNMRTNIKKEVILPEPKELTKIMKFRAFAAKTPLCAQKMCWSPSSSGTEKLKWRDKDTDIEYSGCKS